MNLFTQTQPPPQSPETPPKPSAASSRATDPESSRAASARHEASGRASCNRERLLNEVCRGPGRTAGELVKWLDGIDHVEACRRLPELQEKGLVRPGDSRRCHERGTSMRVWWPTDAGREAGPGRG